MQHDASQAQPFEHNVASVADTGSYAAPAAHSDSTDVHVTPAAPVYTAPVVEAAPAAPTYSAPVAEAAPAAPTYSAPAAEAAPARMAAHEPQPAPVAEPVYVAPVQVAAPKPAPAPVDLERVLQDSGLVLIQTDRSRAVPVAAEAEAPAAPRQKRERRPPPAAEPLMQVETGPKP